MTGIKARFVHPRMWHDDRILSLSDGAKLLFIGMLTLSDDEGRIEIQKSLPLTLGLTPNWDLIGAQLGEIFGQELYIPYHNGNGKQYAQSRMWHTYQKPKYKAESSIIPVNEGVAGLTPNWAPIVRLGSGSGSGSGSGKEHPPTPRKRGSESEPEGFPEFWKLYPKKVGRIAAMSAWKKAGLSNGKVSLVLSAVEAQKSWPMWTRDGGQFIPNPATWLNQGRWQDEGMGGVKVKRLPKGGQSACPSCGGAITYKASGPWCDYCEASPKWPEVAP